MSERYKRNHFNIIGLMGDNVFHPIYKMQISNQIFRLSNHSNKWLNFNCFSQCTAI